MTKKTTKTLSSIKRTRGGQRRVRTVPVVSEESRIRDIVIQSVKDTQRRREITQLIKEYVDAELIKHRANSFLRMCEIRDMIKKEARLTTITISLLFIFTILLHFSNL